MNSSPLIRISEGLFYRRYTTAGRLVIKLRNIQTVFRGPVHPLPVRLRGVVLS
jgi:hypothetical protein